MGPHDQIKRVQNENYALFAVSEDGDTSIFKVLQIAWTAAGETTKDLLGLISRDVRWAKLA